MTTAIILTALLVGATGFDATFALAGEKYQGGDYAGAARLYEQLIAEAIEHPAVFYNLGNTYYRGGRLGAAIANYERALQIDPDFEDAAENLDRCLQATQRRIARPLPPEWEQSLLFWHYRLSRGTTFFLAAVAWFAFWVILGLRQWRAFPYSRMAAVVVLIAAVAFGASAWVKTHPPNLAVASQERVPVFYGTDDDETVKFELYEGDRVTVNERRRNWVRLATINGERGWARADGLTFVGPPYGPPPEVHAGETSNAGAGP